MNTTTAPKNDRFRKTLLLICGVLAALLAAFQASPKTPEIDTKLTTEQLFDYVNRSVCTIVALDEQDNPASQGSGFVLRDSDLIVTNAHVIDGMVSAKVKCGEQIGDVLKIVRYDQNIDLVVAEASGLSVEGLEVSESSEIRPGAQIYAFGSPLGLEGTISPGLASGVRRIGELDYIQISAPISPGSSGGPVTNGAGQVIGISVSSLEGGQNLNFAVPARYLSTLPAVELDVRVIGEQRLADRAPRDDRQEAYPKAPPIIEGDELSSFRGHVFGVSCEEAYKKEKQRWIDAGQPSGFSSVLFGSDYMGGDLFFDDKVLGEPARVRLTCDDRFGLIRGGYSFSRSRSGVHAPAKFLRALKLKYGEGQERMADLERAGELGCNTVTDIPNPKEIRWALGNNLEVVYLICDRHSYGELPIILYLNPIIWRSYKEFMLTEEMDKL